MAHHLRMVQDSAQVDVYEDKGEQFRRWGRWMPRTWYETDRMRALEVAGQASYPLVSKANEGSSSVNVRIIGNRQQAIDHINKAFTDGIEVAASHSRTMQRGYVLLQDFIAHKVTYRVNAIGNARAVFFRYCYPDRPVAQTGNVDPCMRIDDEIESLLEWSDRVFDDIGSKWCALDVLKDGGEWKLLETSLAWPWPSPGTCNEGPIFRSNHRWIGMFDVLMDEIRSGTFG